MARMAGEDDRDETVCRAQLEDLGPALLYRLMQLRVDVFVVEQQCRYRELDGLDLSTDTTHYWIEVASEPVATLRVLGRGHGARIGRVATATTHRGHGYARQLMNAAMSDLGEVDIYLEAQTYLHGWYAGFGFTRAGPEYLEDGIAHVPMLRHATQRSGSE